MEASPQREKWLEAVNAELKSLNEMNTWTQVAKSPEQKVINSKWIFKVKYKPNGQVERFKARLVAKGFMQREGIDYGETFAPVVRGETLRFLISYATQNRLEMDQMDVETAFLNGELEETVYMSVPTGILAQGMVLKLNRSLYGLKQSPRCWNSKFTKVLKENGYVQSDADNCLFVRIENEKYSAIAIYVDDCLIIGNRENVNKIKNILEQNFKMKDLGKLGKIVGIEVERTKEYTKIHQNGFIRDLIEKFRMTDAHTSETPILLNDNKNDNSPAYQSLEQYQSLVGSLIYISTKTRPDIAFAVHEVSTKMSNPTTKDWLAAKRILRYLKGTQNVGIVYQALGNGLLIGFADASFAPKREDRKSIGGYCFILNGGAITWKSKKQSIIALSSCEAELIALTESVKEGQWLQKLFENFGLYHTLIVNEDNQSTVKIAENSVFSDRSKHIQIRFHFLKDLINEKKLQLLYCHTKSNTADILTKGLSCVLHVRHAKGLGLDLNAI
jgi:hypothetical protein